MSMFKDFIQAAGAGGDKAEAEHASFAVGTSVAGALSGDPVAAGVASLVVACAMPEARTGAAFAGVGTSVGCALLFGPIGGLIASTALVAAVRIQRVGVEALVASLKSEKPAPAPAPVEAAV
jgi:hypothetical protein